MFQGSTQVVLRMGFLVAGTPVPLCVYWTQESPRNSHPHSHNLKIRKVDDMKSFLFVQIDFDLIPKHKICPICCFASLARILLLHLSRCQFWALSFDGDWGWG